MDKLDCVGIIGLGKMGSAIARGLVRRQCNFRLLASSRSKDTYEELSRELDIDFGFTENKAVASQADVLFLAVKPQTFGHVAQEIRTSFDSKNLPLVISIMAGIRIERIAEDLGIPTSHVIRSMPNLPGQIGKGITVWTSMPDCTSRFRQLAEEFLKSFGSEVHVESQKFLDIGTALSASGPAYIFLVMEALVDAGVRLGLPRALSHKMVLETVAGSADYVRDRGHHFAEFREAVTSPGGTTAEALYELEKGGTRTVLADAVEAAFLKALKLSK